jgi:gamma-glutamyltranspeptidase / glutathione hydrolase
MNLRVIALGIATLALFATSGAARQQATASTQSRRPVVGRSIVATTFGIVAASQPLAARAGVQILERGGNAIDAAIAANATIGLMEPTGNECPCVCRASLSTSNCGRWGLASRLARRRR